MQSSEVDGLVHGIDFLGEFQHHEYMPNGDSVPRKNVLTLMMVEMVMSGEWQTISHVIEDLMTFYDTEDSTPFWDALDGTQYCKNTHNNPVVGFVEGNPLKRTSLINYTKKILEKVFRRSIQRGLSPLEVVYGLALVLNTDIEDMATKLKKNVLYYIDKMDERETRHDH